MTVILFGIIPSPPGVAAVVPVNFAQKIFTDKAKHLQTVYHVRTALQGLIFSLKEKVRPFYRST